MVKFRIIFGILLNILFWTKAGAQDIHFSMFDMSPLNLNPSLTGMMDGDRRISNIYRTQWKTIGDPLNTGSIAYDQQLYFLPYNMSAGLVFVTDKSGGIDLIENRFLLSAATKIFRGKNTFSIGLQGGIVSKAWAYGTSSFPNQYDREVGQFNHTLPNQESFNSISRVYADINAGVVWKRLTNKGVLLSGLAVHHLNSPDDSFYKNGLGLKPRMNAHVNYDMRLNQDWFIKPSFMVSTMQKAQDMLITAAGGYMLKDNSLNMKRAWLGVGVRTGVNRNGDAFYPTLGIDFKHLNVAMAYDVNFSELNVATNNRGAFEVALIYVGKNTAANKILIPCDRY
jgi:type IX secretion system PorP/SprF family membrane protein